MKKQLVLFSAVTLAMVSYATTFMRVEKTDGTVLKIEVDNVRQVDFVDETPISDTTSNDSILVEYPYVDLDLPSGNLWAKYNVGALNPEEYGSYFAWGEIKPKDNYDWSTYKWAETNENGNVKSITKYNLGNVPGKIDSLLALLPEDDAATANWSSEWRTPTLDDCKELVKYCECKRDTINGIKGDMYTAKNGNWIFIPASGNFVGEKSFNVNSFISFWTSTLDKENEYYAIHSVSSSASFSIDRCEGRPVRPIRSKK